MFIGSNRKMDYFHEHAKEFNAFFLYACTFAIRKQAHIVQDCSIREKATEVSVLAQLIALSVRTGYVLEILTMVNSTSCQ